MHEIHQLQPKSLAGRKHIQEVVMNKILTTLAIIFVFSLVIGCTGPASSKASNESAQSAAPVADASRKAVPSCYNEEIFDENEIVKSNKEWKKTRTQEHSHTPREA